VHPVAFLFLFVNRSVLKFFAISRANNLGDICDARTYTRTYTHTRKGSRKVEEGEGEGGEQGKVLGYLRYLESPFIHTCTSTCIFESNSKNARVWKHTHPPRTHTHAHTHMHTCRRNRRNRSKWVKCVTPSARCNKHSCSRRSMRRLCVCVLQCVLQCVAACAAVCCRASVLQCALQCVAVCCRAQLLQTQHAQVVFCSVLQGTAASDAARAGCVCVLLCVAVYCSVLQSTAAPDAEHAGCVCVCCSAWQCVVVC